MSTFKIDTDKIRDVIGKGGATIRSITEQTGVLSISMTMALFVSLVKINLLDAAVAMVESNTAEAEVGAIYEGKVVRIVDFGAFINILPGKDGLLHIFRLRMSELKRSLMC